jgi:hypothetical protein
VTDKKLNPGLLARLAGARKLASSDGFARYQATARRQPAAA